MGYRQIFIFIEGDKDEIFFSKIIKPLFEKRYSYVRLWKYAEVSKAKIHSFIESIRAMDADYIFVTDINNSPCVTAKKKKIKKMIKNIDIDRIVVVRKEIEGWCLAGLENSLCNRLRAPFKKDTNDLTKEEFNNLIPKKFDSEIDFIIEILKSFSIETAEERNTSFGYFINKYRLL